MVAFTSRISIQRIGQSADITDVIRFLASDDVRFVTATIVPVDGGLCASNGQPKNGWKQLAAYNSLSIALQS